ncbi:GNAT family N-acetyltransferase [Jeotgalibacillus soli]|uniref:Acetyltransferase n=1 Tax=Jeotgalibacillus soli TaxID=889306 RepID=A0A0C2RS93_9BACL|nr:GNAT family N-acetyltransferase [Jeotgalibacillus soli]KIL44614.1 acetyltransferase [Jeotgalibacillus soli]
MTIRIEFIQNKDMPFLWDMLYEMIYMPKDKPLKEELLSRPEIRNLLDGWGRQGDKGFVAFNELNQPVGAAWYRLFDEQNKGYGFIDHKIPELDIALLQHYTGLGIGTMLLEKLLDQASTDGYNAISLSVDPENKAMNLYKKFGFVKVGESGTSWTMKLDL